MWIFLIPFEDGIQGTRYPTPYESYLQKREEENAERGMRNAERESGSQQPTVNSQQPTEKARKLDMEGETGVNGR
ncbi:MAG: hypothetical protein M5U34_26770 [Chloroflexi bacterium]|nr:hypothetical protein [Chloroflexota bacterium]